MTPMRIISLRFERLGSLVLLGRQGEAGATRVEIDCSAALVRYPGAIAHLTIAPPDGEACYAAQTRMDGATLVFDVQARDTRAHGYGRMQAEIVSAQGACVESAIARICIAPSLQAAGEGLPPQAEFPIYEGAYEVTPRAETAVTLETANRVMIGDVTVHPVPRYEVTNAAGGETIYIAAEGEANGNQ